MNVGTPSPGRRRDDERPPRPALIAPTPTGAAALPDEVRRSIDAALDRARRGRRHVTLVSVAVPAEAPAPTFERVVAVLRRTIRQGDGLWCKSANSLVILLADVDGPSSQRVLTRLSTELAAFQNVGVAMGRASAPPGIGARDLLELAIADRTGPTS